MATVGPQGRRLYHGGVPGLSVDGTIFPPALSGHQTRRLNGPRLVDYRSDRVYLTPIRWLATLYALTFALGESGCVYEVKPNGLMESDPDSSEGAAYRVPSVTIVRNLGQLCPCDSGLDLHDCHGAGVLDFTRSLLALPEHEAKERFAEELVQWQPWSKSMAVTQGLAA